MNLQGFGSKWLWFRHGRVLAFNWRDGEKRQKVSDMIQMIRARFEPAISQTELPYSAYYYVWVLNLIKVFNIKFLTK